MSMQATFTTQLGDRVEPGQVTLGSYDGNGPCLTCATPSGKIVIHNPRETGPATLSSLNLFKKISGLLAGPLVSKTGTSTRDILYIGSSTDLLAYDVVNNKDVYHKELPDGVLAMAAGKFGPSQTHLVFAGGNCSLQGFDSQGNDCFWTVTGDNVCAIALCDLLGEGHNQLIVGSDDCDMRVFLEGNDLLHEFSETEAVSGLCDLGGSRFAYCLGNGSIGAYDGPNKSWRVKMKAKPVCILDYDMTMDGRPELVTGWSDGTVDVRVDRDNGTGQILIKDKFPCSIAGIVKGDYRSDGTCMLLVVSVEGEVRGYLPLGVAMPPPRAIPEADGTSTNATSPTPTPPPSSSSKSRKRKSTRASKGVEQLPAPTAIDTQDDEAIRLLEQQRQEKQNLEEKIAELEQQRQALVMEIESQSSMTETSSNLTAPQFQISINQVPSENCCHLQFEIGTPDTIITAVVLQGDGISDSSTIVHFPDSNTAKIVLKPQKNVVLESFAKLIVGTTTGSQYVVHEVAIRIPRFSMLCALSDRKQEETAAKSFAKFQIKSQSVAHLVRNWLNEDFIRPAPELQETPTGYQVRLYCMRTCKTVVISLTAEHLVIETDGLDLAGDLTQALLQTFQIENMDSQLDFPLHLQNFKGLFEKVLGLKATRQRISASIASKSEMAKGLLFQSEDCRSLQQFESMQTAYRELHTLNLDLVAQYNIRCTNHAELMEALKAINVFIQQMARLRAGVQQADVIRGCRTAIKDGNIDALTRVVRFGPTLRRWL
eukprot:m.121640 g.121640  ORF g.121640 m.121640 type:complete len:767 (+) comp28869_c0_seq1:192-2492(+)